MDGKCESINEVDFKSWKFFFTIFTVYICILPTCKNLSMALPFYITSEKNGMR